MPDPISQLLSRHEDLEILADGEDAGSLMSGWQCENPYSGPFLEEVRQREAVIDRSKYSYLEDDRELRDKISEFHLCLDGSSPEGVFCAAGGAVSLLFTFCACLHNRGVREVYYLPPLYFTFHYALKLFGIRARAVSGLQAFEPAFTFNLPDKKTVLLLTDPVWYIGLPIPGPVLESVKEWQQRTGSAVFVDGSFQYMHWDLTTKEQTAEFEPLSTFRLISPTKLLGIHGYRFAYLLLPAAETTCFSTTYANIYGSTASANCAFADVAVGALKERALTDRLVCLASDRHQRLRDAGKIESVFQPKCGYFTFERINVYLPPEHLMSGEYFDQPRYYGYSRLNLLSPSFALLDVLEC